MMARNPHAARTAVITGASRGLGAGMAARFANEGIRLGLCARIRPDPPDGAEALTASVDVAESRAVDEFALAVVERFGPVDLWVNNAGVLEPVGPLATADPEALRRNVDINVLGVMYGSAAFVRQVRDRSGGGVLVNISSGAATNPYEGWAAYCASKAAVEMMTEVIAREERGHGLRAYALAPGVVDTDMQALVRSTPPETFPAVHRFRRIYDEDGLNSPDWVARFILDRLVDGDTTTGGGRVRLRVPDEKADD